MARYDVTLPSGESYQIDSPTELSAGDLHMALAGLFEPESPSTDAIQGIPGLASGLHATQQMISAVPSATDGIASAASQPLGGPGSQRPNTATKNPRYIDPLDEILNPKPFVAPKKPVPFSFSVSDLFNSMLPNIGGFTAAPASKAPSPPTPVLVGRDDVQKRDQTVKAINQGLNLAWAMTPLLKMFEPITSDRIVGEGTKAERPYTGAKDDPDWPETYATQHYTGAKDRPQYGPPALPDPLKGPWNSPVMPFGMQAYYMAMARGDKTIPTQTVDGEGESVTGMMTMKSAKRLVSQYIDPYYALHPKPEPIVPMNFAERNRNLYFGEKAPPHHYEIPYFQQQRDIGAEQTWNQLTPGQKMGWTISTTSHALGGLPGATIAKLSDLAGRGLYGLQPGWYEDEKDNPVRDRIQKVANLASFFLPIIGQAQGVNGLVGIIGSSMQNGVGNTLGAMRDNAKKSATGIANDPDWWDKGTDLLDTVVNAYMLGHAFKFGWGAGKGAVNLYKDFRANPRAIDMASRDLGLSPEQLSDAIDRNIDASKKINSSKPTNIVRPDATTDERLSGLMQTGMLAAPFAKEVGGLKMGKGVTFEEPPPPNASAIETPRRASETGSPSSFGKVPLDAEGTAGGKTSQAVPEKQTSSLLWKYETNKEGFKIPPDLTEIKPAKIGYLLTHQAESDKSGIFAKIGYTSEMGAELESEIRKAVHENPAYFKNTTSDGHKFKVPALINGPTGSYRLDLIWQRNHGEKTYRFITVVPPKSKG